MKKITLLMLFAFTLSNMYSVDISLTEGMTAMLSKTKSRTHPIQNGMVIISNGQFIKSRRGTR